MSMYRSWSPAGAHWREEVILSVPGMVRWPVPSASITSYIAPWLPPMKASRLSSGDHVTTGETGWSTRVLDVRDATSYTTSPLPTKANRSPACDQASGVELAEYSATIVRSEPSGRTVQALW